VWELDVAEELGRRAGVAVDHAQVHDERTQIAATLQEALLPPRLPSIPGLMLAARFRAAGRGTQVGGDFYDLFPVDGGWMVLMGDVTGKGASAAATTSLARYTMRVAARYEQSPARVLERLNETLREDTDRPQQICTALCMRIEPDPHGPIRVTVACGGHPPPLLARADAPVQLVGEPGTLLGAFGEGEWYDTSIALIPGDLLLLFTDGVTDTRGARERFGQERVEALFGELAGEDADAVAQRLDDALLDFQDGPQRDDVALLVMQAIGLAEPALRQAS
jgi:serine phosphatase RsbU (regulator of sigma subunit)